MQRAQVRRVVVGQIIAKYCYSVADLDRTQTRPTVILASLSEHQDPEVRARVAANPNTPQSVLKWLWCEFPPSGG